MLSITGNTSVDEMKQSMGYCRWENTLAAMRECFEHAEDQLSGSEAAARIAVVNTAAELLMGLGVRIVREDIESARKYLAEKCTGRNA